MRGFLALSALAFLSVIPQIFAEAATVAQQPLTCFPGPQENTVTCYKDGAPSTYTLDVNAITKKSTQIPGQETGARVYYPGQETGAQTIE